MFQYLTDHNYNIILLAAGFIALLAAITPVLLERRYTSPPIVYLIIGLGVYFVFTKTTIKPLEHMDVIRRITEFVVIISLTNAGLKIRKPFRWESWRYSFRLLLITMPLTIVAAGFLGWWVMGLAPAGAMLFAALISPTDPVLAAELQTSQPSKDDTSKIKLGLTSEAGMNDGLAFPFTYFAIMAATKGMDIESWIGEWLLHDVLLKIVIGVAVGLSTGWLLFKVIFSIGSKDMLSKISRGILSLSLTLLPYAITEILGGYGFIAVFAAACMFSNYEEHDKHMDSLHDFNEELEGLFVAFLFIATGIFTASYYELLFDWQVITVAALMVFAVRPAAGYISLAGTSLNRFQKFVLSFYGIRGIGSIFYLSYALGEAEFSDAQKLIEVTMATIFLSVLVHGLTARIVQKKIKIHDTA
jgi:NhaP-type Na+/H+ or K+/H+ antiporter